MKIAVFPVNVMRIIRRNKTQVILSRKFNETAVCLFLFRQAMVLNLNEEILPAKNFHVFLRQCIRLFHIVTENGARNLTCNAGRKCDNTCMVFLHELFINARLIVHALNICEGNKLRKVAISLHVLCKEDEMIVASAVNFFLQLTRRRRNIDFAANNRLYSLFFCRFIKVNDTVHIAMIRDCDSIHASFLCRMDEIFDAACTIQKAELRMDVQMCKSHNSPSFSSVLYHKERLLRSAAA